MDEELKKLLEDQTKAIREGREEHEANLKKRDAVTDDKLTKMKETIASKEDQIQSLLDAKEAGEAKQKELEEKFEALERAARRPAAGGSGKSEAQLDDEVKAFNEFVKGEISMDELKAVYDADASGSPEMKNTAMVTNVGTLGGVFVPTRMRDGIIERRFRSSPIRQLATIEQGPIYEFIVERGEISTAQVTEQGSRSKTDTPTFKKVTIDTHEYYARPEVSNRMLKQSNFDVATYLQRKAQEKFARDEAADFVNGTGVSEARGFLTYSTSTSADDSRAAETLQYRATGVSADFAADPAGLDVFNRVYYDMQEYYAMNGTWLMKNTTMAEVSLLKNSNGDPLMRERVINDGQFVNTIMGRPVRQANDMPAMAANSLSIAFGDWSKYVIVDTASFAMIIDQVTNPGFTNFHLSTLVGGGLEDWDAVKLIKFGTS